MLAHDTPLFSAPAMIPLLALSNHDQLWATAISKKDLENANYPVRYTQGKGALDYYVKMQDFTDNFPILRQGDTLPIRNYSTIRNFTTTTATLSPALLIRAEPQIIMAGTAPAVVTKNGEFDVLAWVRPGKGQTLEQVELQCHQCNEGQDTIFPLANWSKLTELDKNLTDELWGYTFSKAQVENLFKGKTSVPLVWGTESTNVSIVVKSHNTKLADYPTIKVGNFPAQ